MGSMKVKDKFVMRGLGTVLMVTIENGTLRTNAALNLEGDYSANVKMIEKNKENVPSAGEGEEVAVVVTAPENLFSKGQEIEFREENVESGFRG